GKEDALGEVMKDKRICRGWGRPPNAWWQVSPYCHTRLKKPCINCSQLLDLPWTLCPYCATPQGGETEGRQKRARRSREQTAAASGVEYEVAPQPTSSLDFIDGDEV